MVTAMAVAVSASFALADSRWIDGTYRNRALGYSVRIPRGLKAIAGNEAGPERGVRVTLPSGDEIVVFGEPNSLEWKNLEEGFVVLPAETELTT